MKCDKKRRKKMTMKQLEEECMCIKLRRISQTNKNRLEEQDKSDSLKQFRLKKYIKLFLEGQALETLKTRLSVRCR